MNGIRLAGVVATACLVLAGPAAAQSPEPDAAPAPSPDPAPSAAHAPKPATTAPAPSGQTQQPAVQTTPTPAEQSPPPSATVPSAPAPRATSAPRRAAHRVKHRKRAAATAHVKVPALPRLEPAQLLASPSGGDDRARRLAIGAVALLLLALASATLVAITARFERRRMMR